jgi:hypothetical protein
LLLSLLVALVGFGLALAGCANAVLASEDGNCDRWNPLLIAAFLVALLGAGLLVGALLLLRPFPGEQAYQVSWFVLFCCTTCAAPSFGVVALSLVIAQAAVLQPQFVLAADFVILLLGVGSVWTLTSATPLFLPDPSDPAPLAEEVAVNPRYEWKLTYDRMGTRHALGIVGILMLAVVGCVLTGFGCADVAARTSADGGIPVCYPFMDWRSGLGVTGAFISMWFVTVFLYRTTRCGRAWNPEISMFVLWCLVIPAGMVFSMVAAYLAMYDQPVLQVPFVDTAVTVCYVTGAICAIATLFINAEMVKPLWDRVPSRLRPQPIPSSAPSAPGAALLGEGSQGLQYQPAAPVAPGAALLGEGSQGLQYQPAAPVAPVAQNEALVVEACCCGIEVNDSAVGRPEVGEYLCCWVKLCGTVCGWKRCRTMQQEHGDLSSDECASVWIFAISIGATIFLTVEAHINILLSLALVLGVLTAFAVPFVLTACFRRSAQPIRTGRIVLGPAMAIAIVAIVAVGFYDLLIWRQPQIGTAGAAISSACLTCAAILLRDCIVHRPCLCFRRPNA